MSSGKVNNLKLKDIEQKAIIHYPCRWLYKVIGTDREKLRQNLEALLQDCSYSVTFSNASATEKYHCLNVEVMVENEAKRLAIYEALKAEPSVKIVL